METQLHKAVGVSTRDLLDFIHTLADTAREVARRYFRANIAVDRKSDETLVTIADRETEQRLRDLIHQRFPGHGIVGEELGADGGDRPCIWVIDPIDGTHGFITGSPLFGTLIGLVVDSIPVAGLLEMPALNERWTSVPGIGTELNLRSCHASARETLSGASLFATTPAMFSADEYPRFAALSRRVELIRFGTDCYAYGLMASGFADLVVEADMKPHDYVALIPVIEGAGGIITDWNGRPLGLGSDGRVLASATPALHREAMSILSD